MIALIINVDREPKYSLYYIGSVIMEELKHNKEMIIEDLYKNICLEIDANLHIDFLYYSLDWLFLLSLIRVEGNRVVLC